MPPPDNLIAAALKQILERRETLSREQAEALLGAILEAEANDSNQLRTAALLGALAGRGETPEELAGFVACLRARSTPLPLAASERERLVDTCGTGGDLSGTFNISTAAALVAAAAGANVAKHGNRAVTSRSGSADVLEALGIPIDLSPPEAADALRARGFAFLSAPAYHPAIKSVMPLRRALGIRTVFNLLGPLANPAGAAAQVIGVYAPHLVPIVAQTLALLGTRHALVVHGSTRPERAPGQAPVQASGLDEFSLAGPTSVAEVRGASVNFFYVHPEDFGLQSASLQDLAGGDAGANAAILRAVFAGRTGPHRRVVLLNAAAVLVVAGLAKDFLEGTRLAADTIDGGQVTALLASLCSRYPTARHPERSLHRHERPSS